MWGDGNFSLLIDMEPVPFIAVLILFFFFTVMDNTSSGLHSIHLSVLASLRRALLRNPTPADVFIPIDGLGGRCD